MKIPLNKALLFALLPFTAVAQSNYSWTNLPKIDQPVFRNDTTSIASTGGVADGITLNTEAIQQAIDAKSAKGGGVVKIPSGLWLTGPIVLKSKVNLHLESGALLMFTADKSQYKLVAGSYEGKSAARNQSPISAEGAEDIAITGKGVIDGNGDVWRAVKKAQLTEGEWKAKVKSGGVLSDDGKSWYPSQQFKDATTGGKSMLLVDGKQPAQFEDMKDFLRPNMLAITNCKRVLLEGVIFQNSPAWCLHPLMCEHLTIRNVMTKNPEYAQNGDGMDIESCSNFLIEGCTLDVGDDAICIKSGKDEEGRRRGKPTQNGVIRNNTVYKAHGGFVIGSEMSGGANNIFVEDCAFIGTDKGLRFKSVRGRGGVVEKIYARNLAMKDIVGEAIFFDMYYFIKFATDGARDTSSKVSELTPIFRDMVFENIACTGAEKGIFIRGLPEMPIRNITIRNSTLSSHIGAQISDASQITLENVKLNPVSTDAAIQLKNADQIVLQDVAVPDRLNAAMSVDGERSNGVKLSGKGIVNAKDRVKVGSDVRKKAVQF